MRIPRIYQSIDLAVGQAVVLSDEAVRHVISVLRLKAGARVVLFNGDDHDYSGTLQVQGKRHVSVHIESKVAAGRESALQIHLIQGIARGAKMDLIIQKAVELGVSAITPVFTEHGNVKLAADRLIKRQHHWQQVAISASEQCGRGKIVPIHTPVKLPEFFSQPLSLDVRLVLSHRAQQSLTQQVKAQSSIGLLIGPEGGLSPEELQLAQSNNFLPALLGPRILRTETAALVAISILQASLGDI